MKRVIVRYKVKPDQVPRNEELVRAVYKELDRVEPEDLRYATFKLDDGVSFAHIAETEDGANPFAEVKAFKEFQEDIGARCDEPPVVTEMETIGSYRV
jgi:hypothetical protein